MFPRILLKENIFKRIALMGNNNFKIRFYDPFLKIFARTRLNYFH